MEKEKQKQIETIEEMIKSAEVNLIAAKNLMQKIIAEDPDLKNLYQTTDFAGQSEETEGSIIKGFFDGQNMQGEDGKRYTVPANYASKSKLVSGDFLKLVIIPDGRFIYKQIKPIARKRLIGKLIKDPQTNNFIVQTSEAIYQVLLASVTYFKGQLNNEVVILVPKDKTSQWAAIENIIKTEENKKQKVKISTLHNLNQTSKPSTRDLID